MKKYNELSIEDKKEVNELFACWLERYSQNTINKVVARADEIINNPLAMNLLRELKDRCEKEEKDFISDMGNLLSDYEQFEQYDMHNNPLFHAESYRDVLYDMYIA